MRPTPLISAALLATIAAAPAQAATVSPAGVRFPQIAVNAKGATVVAWERRTKAAFAVEVRSGATASKLGRTTRLAGRGYSPRVAIGADGTRAVMWLQRAARGGVRTVRVAVARPGHRFGKGQLVDRRHANMATVGVAVQPTGRVVAVSRRSSNRLGYALAPRGHAFGKLRDLTTTGSITSDSLALDPRDGAVVVAYGTPVSSAPPTNQQAGVRTLTTGSAAFSPQTVISDPAGLSESVPAVVAGSGATGVAYNQSGSLRIARRNADGTWAAPELIASPAYGADVFAINLRATLAADGLALATWTISTEPRGRGSISKQTVASIAPPGGRFGAPGDIAPATATWRDGRRVGGERGVPRNGEGGRPGRAVDALRRRRVPARAGATRVQDQRRRPAGSRGQARPRRLAEGRPPERARRALKLRVHTMRRRS